MAMAPFACEPAETMTVALSPRAASQKYSKVENFMATSAKSGAEVISTTAPIKPPIAEKSMSVPRTNCAFPCCVRAKESCV